MKRSLPKRMVTAMAVLGMAAVLAGCGSSDPEPGNPGWGLPGQPGYPGVPGSGACTPLVTGAYGGYGTQQGMVGFVGNNVYWDGRVLRAGYIPGYQQGFGQVGVGAGGTGGPYQRSTGEGSISLSIQQNGMGYPTGYPTTGYPQPGYTQPGYGGSATTANIQGVVQMSQTTLNVIMAQFGGSAYQQPGYTQPGYMPGYYQPQQQVCVSGVAIDLQWNPSMNMLYGGWVYLYLNNTQHGYRMYF